MDISVLGEGGGGGFKIIKERRDPNLKYPATKY